MIAQREGLERFIRRALLTVSPAPCDGIKLTHLVSGNAQGASTLLHLPVDVQADIEPETKRLVAEIEQAAESDASAFNRLQAYAAQSMAGEKPLGTFRFRVPPSSDNVMATDESEPPTPQGALALSMRLTESFARMNLSSFGGIMQGLITENQRLSAENEDLRRRLNESFALREQVLSQQHERDMAMLEVDAREQKINRVIAMGEKLLPAVAAKLSGAEPVKEFIEQLRPDQLETILGTLDDKQRDSLGDMIAKGSALAERKRGNGAS